MFKAEAATGCVLSKNVLLEISKNPQENTCVKGIMWSGAKNKVLFKLKANLLRSVLETKFKALTFKAFTV